MGLEATVKYHFPKGQNFSGTAPQTSPDTLTGTDYIASMGMAMSRAPLGYSAFMGKVGVSENDVARAVSLLTEFALQSCDKVAAFRKLDADIKPAVMQTLATYAYMDYCQSASSKKPCKSCNATGFIDAEVFTTKATMVRLPEWAREVTPTRTLEKYRDVKEVQRVLCPECKGKCVVSSACRDCNGRGQALDRKQTELQGVPVYRDCKQCGGRGFEYTPSTVVYRAISEITDAISLDTWKKSGKQFYESLISRLGAEESWANASLNKVTA